MRALWTLIGPYWKSQDKYRAYGLFLLLIAFNLASVYMAVVLNEWRTGFYNALQELNKDLFLQQSFRFLWIVVLFITVFLVNYYIISILRFRWRQWLTEHYISRWLTASTHYRLKFAQTATDNPDQRISQDLAVFTDSILTLFSSFFKETVTLVSFIGILWAISGPLQFEMFGKPIVIPGYMVWAALLYALIGTGLVFKIGKPIVKLDFEQEKFEANFRYALVRFRERGEEIAIYRGEGVEEANFKHSFKDIIQNFYKILKRQMYIISCQNFYNNLTTIFPVVAAAPLFFSKVITLGVLMQIANAFATVQDSFSILINNFQTIASLRAVMKRLLEFSRAMEALEDRSEAKVRGEEALINQAHSALVAEFKAEILQVTLPEGDLLYQPSSLQRPLNSTMQTSGSSSGGTIVLNTRESSHLAIENLSLTTPRGKLILNNFSLTVQSGEKVLIMGRSGLGKTTILRALAGLWSFGKGAIYLPEHRSFLFVPQRPYLPLGSLRAAIFYPKIEAMVEEKELLAILQQCRLGNLYEHLDEVQDWTHHLSIGEQQRIIFLRAILQKPDWIIMDEPTAAMDKETEGAVYRALFEHLPHLTLITIGHSPSLKAYHERVIDLDQEMAPLLANTQEVPDLQPT